MKEFDKKKTNLGIIIGHSKIGKSDKSFSRKKNKEKPHFFVETVKFFEVFFIPKMALKNF